MTDDLDLAMLDASEWQSAPTVPTVAPEEAPWVDAPWPDDGLPYAPTGATSDEPAAWQRARRTGIGASEIAAVLSESRWGDAGTVYARKVAASAPDDPAEWMEWGHTLEPVILARYSSQRYSGRPSHADRRLLRSREHPWAVCTLDAWTEIDESWRGPLELKTDRWGDGWDNGLPVEYDWQLQHQMLVTGARRASIAVLIGGCQLAWADAVRDDVKIARIIREGARFWARVEAREMPDTVDHSALARVFGDYDRGREIELSGIEWAIADAKRCEAARVALTAQAERAAIDAKIKRAMGRAEVARLDDGTEYRWKANRRGERVLTRKEARV